uniref:Uncharacterized protein n=1 Tax=Manihot esculenta TaxID=3983 RepID=A0A2C9WIQ4_MANES
MGEDKYYNSSNILLGRPFLSMTRAKINVYDGMLSMKFDGEAPKLEVKELPGHFKYAYLGEHETLPVIISSKLTPKEEERLIEVLKEYKSAIGWTITDIKGLSPSTCLHCILLEEDSKPTREP